MKPIFSGINYLMVDGKINGFRNSKSDYGRANVISNTAIDKAIDVLNYLLVSGFLTSDFKIDVSLMTDGGIQFEFGSDYLCPELEIDNNGMMNYLQFNEQGSTFPKIPISDLSSLPTFIEEIKYQKPLDYPDPQNIVVNGTVNFLKRRKYEIVIQTSDGKIYGKQIDSILSQDITNFQGEEATIYGKGHFNTDGTLNFIKIERIVEPSPEDKYFSKIPSAETALQQIERQIAEKPYVNWMEKIAGLWPGNETDEEFDQLLKDMK